MTILNTRVVITAAREMVTDTDDRIMEVKECDLFPSATGLLVVVEEDVVSGSDVTDEADVVSETGVGTVGKEISGT